MNILLQNWELPPFDCIKTEDFEPAINAAIAEAEANVEAIAVCADAPTFANTVEALESASLRLDRISAIMLNLNECCTSDALQEVVMRLEPLMTRFSMKVMTDRRLYDRVKAVQASLPSLDEPLSTEQSTLLDNTLKSFVRHGVALEGEDAVRYKRNEEELSELKLRFGQNALADLNAWTLHITDEADLEGVPAAVRDAARHEAHGRGVDGWLFTLAAPSYIPFMTYKHK